MQHSAVQYRFVLLSAIILTSRNICCLPYAQSFFIQNILLIIPSKWIEKRSETYPDDLCEGDETASKTQTKQAANIADKADSEEKKC